MDENEEQSSFYPLQPTLVSKVSDTDNDMAPPNSSPLLDISFNGPGSNSNSFNKESVTINATNSVDISQENSTSITENVNTEETDNADDNSNASSSGASSGTNVSNGQKFIRRVGNKRRQSATNVSRKRVRHVNDSIDRKGKRARAEGKDGFGRMAPIEARVMKPPCPEVCRKSCSKRITEDDRQKAFDSFWALGDKKKHWDCLNKWIVIKESSNSSDTEAGITKGENNIDHYDFRLPSANGFTSVCKKMFLDTLAISYQWIRTARNKLKNANETGVIADDKRGKHLNRPFRYPEEMKKTVTDHINRFPVMDSHYCRERTKKKYLEEGLSIAKMYRMYLKDIGEAEEFVSQSMYEMIFNTEFNLGFFVPKSDRCTQCEGYKNSPPDTEEKRVAHAMHLEKKKEVRSLMKEDKERALSDPTVCCANFDLQKILTTPRSQVSVMYYKSKLSVWNFTIFQLGTNIGICHLWNETIGHRGSTEIASYVWKFIKSKSDSNVKEIIFYTDNCGGQNRNQNVFSMHVKAANKFGITIVHRFLEVGHTQSEGDSMHARIEKYTKKKEIFTQNEWARLLVDCKEENQYEVKQISQEDIFDFDELSKQYFNWKPVQISQLCELVVTPGSKSVGVKYDFNKESKKINVLKRNVSIDQVSEFELKQAYNSRIPLAEKKDKDLKSMIDANLVPPQFISDFEKMLN